MFYSMFFPVTFILILAFTIYITIAALSQNLFPFESSSDSDNEMDDNGETPGIVKSIFYTTDYKGCRKKNEI